MLLALDLGRKTGWAFGNFGGSVLESGVEIFSLNPEKKFFDFKNWLEKKCLKSDKCIIVTDIFYESVCFTKGIKSAHAFGGFLSILQSFCYSNKIRLKKYSVLTIKKHITGSGRASKNQVIDSVTKFYKFSPKDNNEADALALFSLSNF